MEQNLCIFLTFKHWSQTYWISHPFEFDELILKSEYSWANISNAVKLFTNELLGTIPKLAFLPSKCLYARVAEEIAKASRISSNVLYRR